jgi:spore germination protein YaaH
MSLDRNSIDHHRPVNNWPFFVLHILIQWKEHMLKHSKNLVILLASVFLFSCFGVVEAKTAAKPKPKTVTKEFVRLFYTQNDKRATDSLIKNYRSVDVIAPQAYSVTATGTLIGGVNDGLMSVAKQHKIKVMPLIVNKNFSASAAHSFLDDPASQSLTINAMVQEALQKNYWGWQVDFEQVHIDYKDKFTNFVANLGQALHQNGLVVSVAVIAQTSTVPTDYKNDYWQKFIGVYDYAALASSTDFISLMSYDDPGSTGPVTRYTWLQQVLKFTLQYVPAEKISIGVPLYYWRWNENAGKRVATGTYKQLVTKMNQFYMTKGYSTKEEAAYMRYRYKKTTYTIWYENNRSVKKKIDLIAKNQLHGFSAWALGQEVPNVHQSLTSNKYTTPAELAASL